MDKIERDVYVCQNTIIEPIDYPQGSNAVPIIFHMRDFSIPTEAYYTTVYFRKPSGHEIYDCGTIDQDENDLTFYVSEQMTCESGVMMMTVSIVDKDNVVCNSFNVPFVVQPTSLAEDSGITSCDEYTALQELIQQALSYYDTLQDIEEHIKDLYIQIDVVEKYIEELREKYDNELKQMLNDLEKDFNDWFQNLKDTLDEDAAGHLQLEIEDAQETASNALAQIATGYAYGYISDGYDYASAIIFGEGDDQYYIMIPRKICGCDGMGNGDSNALIANEFNEHKSYAVGDYCIHEDLLYKFTSAHSGAWDKSDVIYTTVANELETISGTSTASISALSTKVEDNESSVQELQSDMDKLKAELEEYIEMNNPEDIEPGPVIPDDDGDDSGDDEPDDDGDDDDGNTQVGPGPEIIDPGDDDGDDDDDDDTEAPGDGPDDIE